MAARQNHCLKQQPSQLKQNFPAHTHLCVNVQKTLITSTRVTQKLTHTLEAPAGQQHFYVSLLHTGYLLKQHTKQNKSISFGFCGGAQGFDPGDTLPVKLQAPVTHNSLSCQGKYWYQMQCPS